MAYSSKTYPGDGVKTDFSVTFDYLDRSHVIVRVNKIETTALGSSFVFTWINDTTVRVLSIGGGEAPSAADEIELIRRTPIGTPAVVFGGGAGLTSENLNKNSQYLTYALQEATDANDEFTRLYLGARDTFPELDDTGNELLVGAAFYYTVEEALYYWTGDKWIIGETTAAAQLFRDQARAAYEAALAAQGASETALQDAVTERQNAEAAAGASASSATASSGFADAAAQSAQAAEDAVGSIPKPTHYFHPENYGAVMDGVADDAPSVQLAINAAALVGGEVFLKQGVWTFLSQINIKTGVSLVGAGFRRDQSTFAMYGTQIDVRWGSGVDSHFDRTKAAVLMEPGTSIRRLGFNYPDQMDTFTPTEYGPTIKMYLDVDADSVNKYHSDVILRELYFHKAFVAIDSRGSSARASGIGFMTTHRYELITMSSIYRGIRLDNVTDWFMLSQIEQQPGFISHNHAVGASLRDYIQKNMLFIECSGLCDWIDFHNCNAWAVGTAVAVNNLAGPLTFMNCEFDAVRVGLSIEGVAPRLGIKFIGCTFTIFDVVQKEAGTGMYSGQIAVASPNAVGADLSFSSCALFGPSKGWVWFANPGVNIQKISITNCTTEVADVVGGSDVAVQLGTSDCNHIIIQNNFFSGLVGDFNGPNANSTSIGGNIS